MDKDKALDLALEALESGQNHGVAIDKLRRYIKQARSAPVQGPVAFNAGIPPLYPEMKDGETISVEYTTPPAQPAPVQEPVSKLYVDGGHLVYPAAQRQWVGLTDEEKRQIFEREDYQGWLDYINAIEDKLKEKNGLHRQHVIDGSPCWCEPETSYTDPETGASVVVHKEPQ